MSTLGSGASLPSPAAANVGESALRHRLPSPEPAQHSLRSPLGGRPRPGRTRAGRSRCLELGPIVRIKVPHSRTLRAGASVAPWVLVIALVVTGIGVGAVVTEDLGRSAHIREESAEAQQLGRMLAAFSLVETWAVHYLEDPNSTPVANADPQIIAGTREFLESAASLRESVTAEQAPVVDEAIGLFESYSALVSDMSTADASRTHVDLDLHEHELSAILLEIQSWEQEDLDESIQALRYSEVLLEWGIPTLVLLGLLMAGLLIRSRKRVGRIVELERMNKARGELVASVSHELRTPLTAVVGLSEELNSNIQNFSPEEIVEFAGVIARESRDVSAIIDDLLVAALVDSGNLKICQENLEVRAEIEQALRSCPRVGEVLVEGEATVRADGGRVRQVIRNLIINAHRYGGDSISISAEPGDREVRIVVADNGPGVPHELLHRLFEPYTAGAPVGGVPSIGLGLKVSRQLARLMGGDLTYAYERGRSLFTLTLPSANPA
jgi:signal transduction histidine kinase